MKLLKKYWLLIIVLLVGISIYAHSVYQGIRENRKVYNFRITALDTTPTRDLVFYNGKEKIELWNYVVPYNYGIKLGDFVVKEKCGKFLYIKRKNENGQFNEIIRVNNISYFANFTCD